MAAKDVKHLLDMDLQFFAESGNEPGGNDPDGAGDNGGNDNGDEGGDGGDESITLEQLMRENAKLKAEFSRNKTALDKALKNNGELTKQLRAKMTAAEQEEEAKREAAEAQQREINELKEFKRRAEATERYLAMGMSADFAKQAAEAEVAGDMEALTNVQSQHTAALLKAQKEEWLKSRPDVNAGHGEDDGGEEDPFLKGFRLGGL